MHVLRVPCDILSLRRDWEVEESIESIIIWDMPTYDARITLLKSLRSVP